MESNPTGPRAGSTSISSASSRTLSRPQTHSKRKSGSARLPRGLTAAGLSARKSLGQHFLTDRRILRRVASATRLTAADTVVEVGAGLGALTSELAKRAARVIAVEVDEALCNHLCRRFEQSPNVTVVCRDVLSVEPADLGVSPPYVVAGNLPYNIGAAVLRLFLEAKEKPERLIVMLQREVAENIVARPGRLSLLALSVQLYAEPHLLFTVPPSAFRPPPKVESAVLRLDVRERPAVAVDDTRAFFRFLRAGFSSPRKQLRNVLSHALDLDARLVEEVLRRAGIEPSLRAQALTLQQWASLYHAFESIEGNAS
jgi:16S rRNA (adenine1518-N6/adenine1519-N6)-dimethyltransferase